MCRSLLVGLRPCKVAACKLKDICGHLDEGSGDEVVQDLLNLGVLLQVLGVLASDSLLRVAALRRF